MKLDLIRQMNESVREKDDYEKALDEAGIEFDMGDGSEEELDFGDDSPQPDEYTADDMANDDFEDPRDEVIEPEIGMGNEEDMYNDFDAVVARLVDAYKGNNPMGGAEQGSADEMENDELQDLLGDDLEQLGFSPEQVDDGISQIMSALGRDAA